MIAFSIFLIVTAGSVADIGASRLQTRVNGEVRQDALIQDMVFSVAELIAYCKTRAAGYKAPRSVEFREDLARTATGKLQKFKLREEYWQGRDRQVN